MSTLLKINNKKAAAAGAALVALSGFVPSPLVPSAHAAATTLTVTGSFITGIAFGGTTSVKFGKMVATGAAGAVKMNTAGALATVTNVKGVSGNQNGTIKLTAQITGVSFSLTASNIGTVVLAATGGGAGPQGTVKITKLLFGGAALVAAKTITAVGTAGSTSAKANSAGISKTINVGAQLTTAGQPIGAFTSAVAITAAF